MDTATCPKRRHLSPTGSPVPFSPSNSSSSPTPPVATTAINFSQQQQQQQQHQPGKISGIPCVASASRFPDSRLAKMFNGSIPIVLDSLKQHYFIDRDGQMFRHILNFMRNSKLLIPNPYEDLDLLLEEARYFDIQAMCKQLENLKKELKINQNSTTPTSSTSPKNLQVNNNHTNNSSSSGQGRQVVSSTAIGSRLKLQNHENSMDTIESEKVGQLSTTTNSDGQYQCLALNISPDLGERIMLSGERSLIEEVFPEAGTAVMDVRTSVAWHADQRHVIRFPLNGYCKLNSVQAITRLLNSGYHLGASHGGGGIDGNQFSEYLFLRKIRN